jgi:hypothetical protein
MSEAEKARDDLPAAVERDLPGDDPLGQLVEAKEEDDKS